MSSNELQLFAADQLPAPLFGSGETVKEFTAELLRQHRPDIYQAVANLRRQRVPYATIQRALGVGPNTISAVCKAEKVIVHHAREGLAIDFRHTAQRLIERVDEVLDDPEQRAKLSAKDAAFSASTLSERADAMQGHATSILEVVVSDPGRDDLARLALKMGLMAGQGGTMRAEVTGTAEAGGAGELGAGERPAVIEGEFQERKADV